MTLFAFARSIVREAEASAANGADLMTVLPLLRKLSLEDFGLLMISMPNSEYPALSLVLPAMASDAVQKHWTGKAGADLFVQTAAFARQVASIFAIHSGRPLTGAKILDYGCGYGRNVRSMLYFTDPENMWGIDAWQSSLNIAINDRVPGKYAKADAKPQELPVGEEKFDLIFAFSVFTHISQEHSEAILRTTRGVISANGICIVTIRPVEYWEKLQYRIDRRTIDQMMTLHNRSGYAYRPSERSKDGDFGEASMPLAFFNRCGWQLVGYDSTTIDPYQLAVILKPQDI